MTISNAEVADTLRRYATAIALEGADRFKINAYRRAAETIEDLDTSVALLVNVGKDLKDLPGVGKAISSAIEEIVRRGKLSQLDRLLEKLSPELVELAERPALDPKKVMRIYKKLDIKSLQELGERLRSGEIGDKFGHRIEYHVRQGLDDRPRRLLYAAEPEALRIEKYLKALLGVSHVARAGSLRRKKDTVGDLNFLVCGRSAAAIFQAFAKSGFVKASEAKTRHERLFKLSSGSTVGLAWSPAREWGLSLLKHTGSATHVDDVQRCAKGKRIELSPKALAAKRIDVSTEEGLYRAIGLPFIEPELREGRGEVQAATRKRLPRLIELKDLRGDLHMHTTASDGANTILEMATAAREKGYEYIAITDHSQSLKITNGLSPKRLLQQIKAIDKLNVRLKQFVILKSAEVDILEDGKLDYPNAVLKELDLRICSIHSRFNLDKERQTERIMRAMDNPYFNILGHATGRLLLKREGYQIDIERIIRHAKDCGCYFEINSSPDRLDLSDEHAKLAKEHSVKIAINTDAHSIAELNFISAGLNQARRGWLEPSNVLNALSIATLRSALRR